MNINFSGDELLDDDTIINDTEIEEEITPEVEITPNETEDTEYTYGEPLV